MEYTVQQLASLAGVSTRTLRYYDSIGLLSPARLTPAGYRIYTTPQVDRLQQILFYKNLGLSLSTIQAMLDTAEYNPAAALEAHLAALYQQKETVEKLIETTEKSLQYYKGKTTMKDNEKFEGFKKQLLAENEAQYGAELTEKFGEETIAASNAKIMKMSAAQYEAFEALSKEINQTLRQGVETSTPASPIGQKLAALHKEWLCYTWPRYSYEAHKGLAQAYVDDPRFTAYYEKIVPGGAVFLRDAIVLFCEKHS